MRRRCYEMETFSFIFSFFSYKIFGQSFLCLEMCLISVYKRSIVIYKHIHYTPNGFYNFSMALPEIIVILYLMPRPPKGLGRFLLIPLNIYVQLAPWGVRALVMNCWSPTIIPSYFGEAFYSWQRHQNWWWYDENMTKK